MYIALIVVVLILFVILIPIKITIDYEFYSKDYDINDEDVKKEIKIYIFRFLKVKTIKKLRKEETNYQENSKSKNNKIIYNAFSVYKKYIKLINGKKSIGYNDFEKLKKSIKFEKLYLSLGYNTKNIILNAYIMAALNCFINSYIAKNGNNFNLKNTKYETYISKNLLKLKIKCIANFNLANTIYIVFKLIIKYMKGGIKNGKKASNRKFNDDSYDFT